MNIFFAVSPLEGRKIPLFLAEFKRTNVTELIYVFPMHLFIKLRWGSLQNRFCKTTGLWKQAVSLTARALPSSCLLEAKPVRGRGPHSGQRTVRPLRRNRATEHILIVIPQNLHNAKSFRFMQPPHNLFVWTMSTDTGGGGAECCVAAPPLTAGGCGKGEEKLDCRRMKSSRPIHFLSSGCSLL